MPTDILIIGAGPVGLTLAAELTRFGLAVRIVDTAPERTDKSKALAVWPRTLEHLQRLDLAEKFVAAGSKATQARLFQVAKQIGHIQIDAIGSQATPFPFALMLPQSETERLLEEHLASLGVRVERSTTLTALSQDADSVTATLSHNESRAGAPTETVTVPWLIGCDGAHSSVRHALNAAFEGDTLPSDWVLGDVHLTGPIDPGQIELHLHADGILGLFPIPPDRFRIIASYPNAQSTGTARPNPTLAEMQQLLDQRSARGLKAVNPVWLSAFHINERKVADFRSARVFLAGDAAHVHSPAGGQGMNTGMQDSFNLAWKLALMHRHLVSPAAAELLLSSYTAERGPVAAAVLRDSGRLTRFATLDNALLRDLRNHFIRFVSGFDFIQHALAETITELAIAYPDSPLNGPNTAAAPQPGHRAPIRPHEPPVSTGPTPCFTLFADPDSQSSTLLSRFSDLLDPALRSPFEPGGLWLVRPDGYVALAAKSGDWNAAAAFLDRLAANHHKDTTTHP